MGGRRPFYGSGHNITNNRFEPLSRFWGGNREMVKDYCPTFTPSTFRPSGTESTWGDLRAGKRVQQQQHKKN